MVRTIFFTAFFLACVIDSNAQNDVSVRGEFAPPDTFVLYTYQSVKPYPNLDSIGGTTTDTLTDPAAFIIDMGESLDHEWRIAVKSKNAFVVFNPFEDINVNPRYSQCVVSRKQFDGKGSDELIVERTYTWSRHAYAYGLDAAASGVLIIDIDKFTRIMNYQNHHFHDQWQNYEVPDTTDTLGEMELITVLDRSSESYLVTISEKCVVIKQECLPPEPIDEERSPEEYNCDKTVYNYRLTKNGLIRKK